MLHGVREASAGRFALPGAGLQASRYLTVVACCLYGDFRYYLYPCSIRIHVVAYLRTFRINFECMFGLKGKGMHLIFIAFLCSGLKDTDVCLKAFMWSRLPWLGLLRDVSI